MTDLQPAESDKMVKPINELSSRERKELIVNPLLENGLDIEDINIRVESLEEVIEQENLGELKKWLKEVIDDETLTLYDLITPDGMTLLHICTQKNATRSFNLILTEIKNQYSSQEGYHQTLKRWVRQSTFKDCFSPLHYASYRGNIQMIEILI